MSAKPEPAILSCDTGQRYLAFKGVNNPNTDVQLLYN